mgnify:CR=1 FL=1
MKPTFTEVQEIVNEWLQEVEFDLKQDWNQDKKNMILQQQSLVNIKIELQNIKKIGGQIFQSSIKK